MIARPIPFGLLLLGLAGCGKLADDVFCASAGCDWKPGEWERVAALANPGPSAARPVERSGATIRRQPAGPEVLLRSARSRATRPRWTPSSASRPPARAAKAPPIGISCATCHDLGRGGRRHDVGAGARVGRRGLDGRQRAAGGEQRLPPGRVLERPRGFAVGAERVVAESATTMNGNRLRTAHRIVDAIPRPLIEQVFGPESARRRRGIAACRPTASRNGPNACDQRTDPTEPFDVELSADQQTMVTRCWSTGQRRSPPTSTS